MLSALRTIALEFFKFSKWLPCRSLVSYHQLREVWPNNSPTCVCPRATRALFKIPIPGLHPEGSRQTPLAQRPGIFTLSVAGSEAHSPKNEGIRHDSRGRSGPTRKGCGKKKRQFCEYRSPNTCFSLAPLLWAVWAETTDGGDVRVARCVLGSGFQKIPSGPGLRGGAGGGGEVSLQVPWLCRRLPPVRPLRKHRPRLSPSGARRAPRPWRKARGPGPGAEGRGPGAGRAARPCDGCAGRGRGRGPGLACSRPRHRLPRRRRCPGAGTRAALAGDAAALDAAGAHGAGSGPGRLGAGPGAPSGRRRRGGR